MADACVTCNKSAPEVTLKRCAKCSSTPYCSRDCQKADWKSHRKTCGKQSEGSSSAHSAFLSSSASKQGSPPKGLESSVPDPFTRLGKGTWLHDRPETDVYRLLIDAYRLRVEDEYALEGNIQSGSLYSSRR